MTTLGKRGVLAYKYDYDIATRKLKQNAWIGFNSLYM